METFVWPESHKNLIKIKVFQGILASSEKHWNHTYTFYNKCGATPSPRVILSLLSQSSVGFKSLQVDKYHFFTRENKLNCDENEILCIKHEISLGKPWRIKILTNIYFLTVLPHWNTWEIIDLMGGLILHHSLACSKLELVSCFAHTIIL